MINCISEIHTWTCSCLLDKVWHRREGRGTSITIERKYFIYSIRWHTTSGEALDWKRTRDKRRRCAGKCCASSRRTMSGTCDVGLCISSFNVCSILFNTTYKDFQLKIQWSPVKIYNSMLTYDNFQWIIIQGIESHFVNFPATFL